MLFLHTIERIVALEREATEARNEAELFVLDVQRKRLSKIPKHARSGSADVISRGIGGLGDLSSQRHERANSLMTTKQLINDLVRH